MTTVTQATYWRLRQELWRQIQSGSYSPGQYVPSERVLARKAAVARMTARQALQSLATAGILKRVPGKGYLVSTPRTPVGLLYQSTAWVVSSYTVLSVSRMNAHPAVAHPLEITPQEPVLELVRLAHAKGLTQLEYTYLPEQLCSGLEFRVEWQRCSLGRILADRYDLRPVRLQRWVTACVLGNDEAGLLEQPLATPAIQLESIIRLVDGRVAAYSLARCPAVERFYEVESNWDGNG